MTVRVPARAAPTAAVVALVIVVGFVLSPDRSLARSVSVLAGVLLAIGALAWRSAATPRGQRGVWVLLLAAMPLFALSDLMVLRYEATNGTVHPWPGPAHVPFQIGLVLLLAAVATVTRRSRPARTSDLDAAVVAASLAIAVWVGVVAPLLRAGLLAQPGRAALLVTHALLHVLLVLAVSRLASRISRRSVAGLALTLGLTALILTSIGMGTLNVVDRYRPDGLFSVGWILAAGGLAVAATHPSARQLVGLDPAPPPAPIRRIAPHAVAALVLPTVLLASPTREDVVAIALATGAVLILISVRMLQLLRELEAASQRDLADERERSRRRFEALVRDAGDVVLVIRDDGVVDYATPSAAGVFGADPTGWSLRRIVAALHPEERRATAAALRDRWQTHPARPIRARIRLQDAQGRDLDADLVLLDRRADPDVAGLVLTLHDTTERTALERELRELAYHDPLTGLPNRTHFTERIDTALERAARTDGAVAVLLCDLDDFKDVNDTLGHPAGDALLQQLGGRLSAQLRAEDTLARIGGDEFAVVCENLQTTQDAIGTAQRLIEAVRDPFVVEGHTMHVAMSVGITVDRGERTTQELVRDADIALYEAKLDANSTWCLHRATMTTRTAARRALSDDLARAIADQAIGIELQAIHALDDGRMVGLEALARWHHPVQGSVPPERFVRIAEQTGAIDRLGSLVLDQALASIAALPTASNGAPLRVGVNLSPLQLRDPTLPDRVAQGLAAHGLAPERLILELTESAMVQDDAMVLDALHALRRQGVRLAIDDFGTGYSSLAYLRRLPVDIIKLDRNFVREVTYDDASRHLVASIIGLCRTLDLDVVAEGIETPAQYRLLADMGAGFAQGYLLHRPSDVEGIRRHLHRRPAIVRVETEP